MNLEAKAPRAGCATRVVRKLTFTAGSEAEAMLLARMFDLFSEGQLTAQLVEVVNRETEATPKLNAAARQRRCRGWTRSGERCTRRGAWRCHQHPPPTGQPNADQEAHHA